PAQAIDAARAARAGPHHASRTRSFWQRPDERPRTSAQRPTAGEVAAILRRLLGAARAPEVEAERPFRGLSACCDEGPVRTWNGTGQLRRSRRTIRPLIRQDEQNGHALLRVIRHQDG